MEVARAMIPAKVLRNGSVGQPADRAGIDEAGLWRTQSSWAVFVWRLLGRARHALGFAPQLAWRRV